MELPTLPDYIHARVLVVDDHPTTAVTLARAIALLGRGIEALAARSGEEALQLAEGHRPDILVTDLMMPGINGMELIEKLQSKSHEQPLCTIVITAHAPAGAQLAAPNTTIHHILLKPVHPQLICELVSRAIHQLYATAKGGLSTGNAPA